MKGLKVESILAYPPHPRGQKISWHHSALLVRPRGAGALLGCGRRRPTAESTRVSAGTPDPMISLQKFILHTHTHGDAIHRALCSGHPLWGSPSTHASPAHGLWGSAPPGRSPEHCRTVGRGPARGRTGPRAWSAARQAAGEQSRRVLRSRGQACLRLRAPWQVGGGRSVPGGAQARQEEPAGGGNQWAPGGPSCHSVRGGRAPPPNLVLKKREGGGGREGLMRQSCLPADAGMGAGTAPRAPRAFRSQATQQFSTHSVSKKDTYFKCHWAAVWSLS